VSFPVAILTQTSAVPMWLIGLGLGAGLIVLAIVYGLVWLILPAVGRRIASILSDGVLSSLLYCCVVVATISAIGSIRMPVGSLTESLGRVFQVGPIDIQQTIPAGAARKSIDVTFRGAEVSRYEISSDQDLQLEVQSDNRPELLTDLIVQGGVEPKVWVRTPEGSQPFPGTVTAMYVTNDSQSDANLKIHVETNVAYPQVMIVPKTAFTLIAAGLLYVGLGLALPKTAAVAGATARQAMAQPLFALAIIIGVLVLIAYVYVPFFTFGEDVKLLKSSGLATIMVLAIVLALWTASQSVAEEIEGRTALTILSKPVGRRAFIVGKFLGIVWPIVILFAVLGFVFLLCVSYKVMYDARETSQQPPNWQMCFYAVNLIIPGLALSLMQTVVMAAISVAISTRLPVLPNLLICTSIYLMGHLVPLIVDSSASQFAIVRFVGMFVATVFPVLEHFNVEAAIASDSVIPGVYLIYSLVYCALYSTIALLLALALFEDRDLA